MSILVFANGDIQGTTGWFLPDVDSATKVIAVDGGARHLLAVDRLPHLVIGDLDSLNDYERDFLEKEGAEIHLYPREKNETDLELGLLFIVEQANWHLEPIDIYGVLGGRLDQQLANILLLAHPKLAGRIVRLVEPHQRAWLVKDHTRFDCQIGDTVSLIPLGGDAQIRHTDGLRWPLIDDLLAFGPARGVSNEATKSEVRVELESGVLLCIHTDHNWKR